MGRFTAGCGVSFGLLVFFHFGCFIKLPVSWIGWREKKPGVKPRLFAFPLRLVYMQTYLFIGGNQDGLNMPVADGMGAVQLPAGVRGKDNYISETLTVGDASITVFRHESLAAAQVIDRLVEHYKAWCVNMPGGRR
jgi:hypothetical protein